ncbi:NYN domain-containing protein [Nocardioides sp. SR21]|uniref:NYN domain-containing protein n=1 Tax=Nocardioides sp. SR21 TaxID=2919501 RepID=UPI001FAA6D1C|nr:NYN domain-containing protein [Nocardioides sp. SR21]
MTDESIRLAVLIDADNTSAKFVREMFDELAGYGTITVKRAYGDWSSDGLKGWREVLLGNAISPRQQFAYTSGKNATDSALIIDAMDLLYSGNVDGFALVSSDSDFTPLAMRLRESGKRVIGVGRRKTPKAFVEACERFLFLEVFTEAAATPEQTDENPPRPIQSVLTKALNKAPSDDENWTSLAALGNHLNRTDPSFDSRNYGFGKLSDLVVQQPFLETKTVKNTSGRGSLWVRLRGRKPAPAEPAPPSTPSATKKSPAKKSSAKKTAATAAKKSAAPSG